jgi:nucleotide-binding universal stress UspA family protein
MSICVAVTDSEEGQAAFRAAAQEAVQLDLPLVAVNLTGSDLDTSSVSPGLSYEVLVPSSPSSLDEVEQVLRVLENRPEITRLVVGVRKRSPVGKAVLGSIAQRLILEAPVPVLSVKASQI